MVELTETKKNSQLGLLLDKCAKYERYRFPMKDAYFELLVCSGLSGTVDWRGKTENWMPEVKCRSKSQQKSAKLWKKVEEIGMLYLVTNPEVKGEQQFLDKLKPVLEDASIAEEKAQRNIAAHLQILQSFFLNGYEDLFGSMLQAAEKSSMAEEVWRRDSRPKRLQAFEKAAKKYQTLYEKVETLVMTLKSEQAEHLKTIELVFAELEQLNSKLAKNYEKLKDIQKTGKVKSDAGKRTRIEAINEALMEKWDEESGLMKEDQDEDEG